MNRRLIKILIIIWSVIAFIAAAFLVYGISHAGSFGMFEFGHIDDSYIVQKSQSIQVSNCNKIGLNFPRGNVIIQTTNEPSLKVVQSSSRKLKDKDKFTIKKQGDNIQIETGAKNRAFTFSIFDFDEDTSNEKIEIYIPKDYAKDLDVNTSSGNILFSSDMKLNDINCSQGSGDFKIQNSITANNAAIKTNSGDIYIASLDSKYYNIEAASGDILVKYILGSGNAKAVSGNIKMNYKSIGEYAKASSTSGDVKLILPQNLSFKFEGECTSGDIKGDFPLNYENDRKSKASAQVGNDPYKTIDVSTVSGDIDISSK
ncbi:DUF4097 domain-containing protein [Clostridium sp. JN-1]|uniref:DUF4097 domain-containing protein n=1 Tax=Clostridium sp. JN-1 TaxID=2483110 RepID=UPI000F0BB01C|nr:DUF4097 domain-containing protein [Clostridium sp. JN-1]